MVSGPWATRLSSLGLEWPSRSPRAVPWMMAASWSTPSVSAAGPG